MRLHELFLCLSINIKLSLKVITSMSLKDFAIMEQLGQGSYAKVFKVLRHTDNKIYALKQVTIYHIIDPH